MTHLLNSPLPPPPSVRREFRNLIFEISRRSHVYAVYWLGQRNVASNTNFTVYQHECIGRIDYRSTAEDGPETLMVWFFPIRFTRALENDKSSTSDRPVCLRGQTDYG